MVATRSLIPRDVWSDMISLRDVMDRMLDGRFIAPVDWLALPFDGKRMPPIDMYEEGNNLVVKAPMPGIQPEELKIEVRNDVLTISGETKKEEEHKDRNYYHREYRYGSFERSVNLPCPVQVDKAEAIFENGVVTLTLPRAEETPVKRIPIKAK